jgi:hypothetical protein
MPSGKTDVPAFAIDESGVVLGYTDEPIIWHKSSTGNYVVSPLGPLITNGAGWASLDLRGISRAGHITGIGRFNGRPRAFLLTPKPSLRLNIRTDTDRDGATDFDGTTDATGSGRPYYFWTNDDNDSLGTERPGGLPDSSDAVMARPTDSGFASTVMRDLEDFARLTLQLTPALKAAVTQGATLALEARGAGTIHLFPPSRPGDNETRYLTDEAYARSLVLDPATGNALPSEVVDQVTSWKNLERLITEADWSAERIMFLWEGVDPGACLLTLRLLQTDGAEIISEPVHLSLRAVGDYFEWVRATPRDGFEPPWKTDGQFPAIDWETVHPQRATPSDQQNIDLVWVHGWRLTQYERRNWAEMMFKRLWHAGYKGRLRAFTWPTLSSDDPLFESGPDGRLSYDRSEYRAWKSGRALEDYLQTLRARHPSGRLVVTSHSMGNVVTAEALLRGGPADLQIMMQAALPAGCYDDRTSLDQVILLSEETKNPTPDLAADLGYRGHLAGLAVPTVSFYNESDFALQTGTTAGFSTNWIVNQRTKPDDPVGKGTYEYRAGVPGLYSGKKLLRQVVDIHESQAFIARSRSRAVGAEALTRFPLAAALPNVDLQANFGFTRDSDEHSAQFNRPIQRQLVPFFSLLRRTIGTDTP